MNQVQSITWGISFFQKTEGEETSFSIAFRTTSIALGFIAIVTSAFDFNVGAKFFDTSTNKWSLFGCGVALLVIGKSIKFIKKGIDTHNHGKTTRNVEDYTCQKNKDKKLFDEFEEKIIFLDTFDKNIKEIAAALSKITPPQLQVQEVVDTIFKKSSTYKMALLIDAVLINFPSFKLSSFDKIRKAIIEDKKFLLTNQSIFAMLKEIGLDDVEEKIDACYELAYRIDHPYIYPLSASPVGVDEYTVNFLWVNLNPQNRVENTAQNIFGDGLNIFETAECIKDPEILRKLEETEQNLEKIKINCFSRLIQNIWGATKDLHRKASSNGMNLQTTSGLKNWRKIKKSFSYKISKWADVNPNAHINLWFDSALVTQKAYQKTFEMMSAISETRRVNIRMRDIRRLPNISGEIEHSLHPGTQVYYRVDLLKALITDYMISDPKESAKYCVVSDFDIEPMSPEQMFDERTLIYLNSNGYVFNKVGLGDFENNFFIFNKEKKDIHQNHKKTIIYEAADTISKFRKYPKDTFLKNTLGAQTIYNFYKNFRLEMKEEEEARSRVPRKVVRSPLSQFYGAFLFSDSDYKSETFRFIGEENVPYTRNGRSNSRCEKPIQSLLSWESTPLEFI